MKKTFKRDINLRLLIIGSNFIVVLMSICFIAGAVASISPILDISVVIKFCYLVIVTFVLYMLIMLMIESVVPSFDYIIDVQNNTFIISEANMPTEPIILNKQFELIKHKKYLTLDDGNTTIDLFYNKELLEFLHQIQIKENET